MKQNTASSTTAQNKPVLRIAKLNEVRVQILLGTYRVDPLALGSAMLRRRAEAVQKSLLRQHGLHAPHDPAALPC